MKILIIDSDETEAAELEHLIKQVNPSIELLDRLSTVQDAVRYLINKPQPDLIFLDIQLDDGICFDIFQEVKSMVPLVFTSRNASWAVRALKLNTLGYLTKPLDRNSIISIFYKYKTTTHFYAGLGNTTEPSIRKQLLNENKEPGERLVRSRFTTQLGDKIRFVATSDIAWFKADGNLVFLITFANDRLILDETLEEIHAVLDLNQFFRVNRTYICRVTALKDVRKYFNSRLKITLQPEPDGDEEILVSRTRVHAFMSWLGS